MARWVKVFQVVCFLFAIGLLGSFPASASQAQLVLGPPALQHQTLAQLARSAEMYLDVALFTLASDKVTDELIAAKQRGVTVRVVIDRREMTASWRSLVALHYAGVPVRANSLASSMRHNFILADHHAAGLLSFHLTQYFDWACDGAVACSTEVITLIDDHVVGGQLGTAFEELWQDKSYKLLQLAEVKPKYTGILNPHKSFDYEDYSSSAASGGRLKDVYVRGYTRRDGTHVNSYMRSSPRRR